VNEQTAQVGAAGLLAKGSKVGKYEVVERIGMGGQATVYKCYDPLLDRFVAVKQISSHLAGDPKFLERFRKEAQILAKLGNEQESIVTIHELIQDEQGMFIVMEFLDGPSLEVVLQDTKGPSEPKAVLQIIWRLAAAMHAVHSAGIIHRDLKPSNIIVCGGLRPKITDFGIAAMSGDASMPLGTTKYMAPELYESNRKVDGRVDLYSLGFIAYELLAGRPKFEEIFQEIVRDKHGEQLRWMKWHGNPAVKAPSLEEISPGVPVGLSQIVAKMMDKDPEKRFRSMEELGRAIKVTFSPRGKATAAGAGVRRRRPVARPAAAAAAAGGAALTAGDTGAALGPPDAGDELVLAPDGAATAPLPSTRWGRKLLLFFVLPAVFLMIVGGAVALVVHKMNTTDIVLAKQLEAKRIYDAGEKAMKGKALISYSKADFQEALKSFDEVRSKYPYFKQAIQAGVLEPICQAYVNMADNDWEAAIVKETKAGDEIKRVQAIHPELDEWARSAKDYVANLHSYRLQTNSFRDMMAAAAKELANKKYAEAGLVITRGLTEMTLTPKQQEEVAKFRAKVDLTEFRDQLLTQVKAGDEARDAKDPIKSQAAYEDVLKMLQGEQVSILPPKEAQDLKEKMIANIKALTENRTLNERQAAVDKARADGDLKLLLIALRELYKVKPDPKIKEEMNEIQAKMALAKAREYIAAGKLTLAREWLKKVLEYTPTGPIADEAKLELAKLDKADEWAAMIATGDGHFAAGRWTEALVEYEKAAKARMDDTLRDKIVVCRFQIALAKADVLRGEGKIDEATKAYQEALAIKPSAKDLVGGRLEAMQADVQYKKLMADGNAAMKREQWDAARAAYQLAQKIRDTVEVKTAIAETRYQQNLQKGKEAFEQSQWDGALAYFKLAKSFKDCEEIRGWIFKTEQKQKSGDSAGPSK
jgi:tetratricopeptide (TPR) repeat protein